MKTVKFLQLTIAKCCIVVNYSPRLKYLYFIDTRMSDVCVMMNMAQAYKSPSDLVSRGRDLPYDLTAYLAKLQIISPQIYKFKYPAMIT